MHSNERNSSRPQTAMALGTFPFQLATLVLIGLSGQAAHSAVITRFDFAGNDYVDDAANTANANTGLDFQNSAGPITGVTSTGLLLSPGMDAGAALGFCGQ